MNTAGIDADINVNNGIHHSDQKHHEKPVVPLGLLLLLQQKHQWKQTRKRKNRSRTEADGRVAVFRSVTGSTGTMTTKQLRAMLMGA